MNMTKLEKYFSRNGYRFNVSGENKTGRDFSNFSSAFEAYLKEICEQFQNHIIFEKENNGEEIKATDTVCIEKFYKGYFYVNAVIRYQDQFVNVFTPNVRIGGWERQIVVRIMKDANDSTGGMNNNTTVENIRQTIASVIKFDSIYKIENKYYSRRKIISAGNNVATLWGATCDDFDIDYDAQIITFLCNEHGEQFVTSIDFKDLEKNI